MGGVVWTETADLGDSFRPNGANRRQGKCQPDPYSCPQGLNGGTAVCPWSSAPPGHRGPVGPARPRAVAATMEPPEGFSRGLAGSRAPASSPPGLRPVRGSAGSPIGPVSVPVSQAQGSQRGHGPGPGGASPAPHAAPPGGGGGRPARARAAPRASERCAPFGAGR